MNRNVLVLAIALVSASACERSDTRRAATTVERAATTAAHTTSSTLNQAANAVGEGTKVEEVAPDTAAYQTTPAADTVALVDETAAGPSCECSQPAAPRRARTHRSASYTPTSASYSISPDPISIETPPTPAREPTETVAVAPEPQPTTVVWVSTGLHDNEHPRATETRDPARFSEPQSQRRRTMSRADQTRVGTLELSQRAHHVAVGGGNPEY